MLRRLRLALALAVLAASLASVPAGASCATTPTLTDAIAAADTVFVGTVTDTGRYGSATFLVAEVWKGADLPSLYAVKGPSDTATSDEQRAWELGQRYLVVALRDQGVVRDDACSATRPWTDALSSLRPAAVRSPADEVPTSGPPGAPPFAFVFLGILVIGSVGAYLLYRGAAERP